MKFIEKKLKSLHATAAAMKVVWTSILDPY